MSQRAAARARRIVAHRAANHRQAFLWDLDFWLEQTPEERLAALDELRCSFNKIRKTKRGKADHGNG